MLLSLIFFLNTTYKGFFSKIIVCFDTLRLNFIDRLNDSGYAIVSELNLDAMYVNLNQDIIFIYKDIVIISLIIIISAIVVLCVFKKYKPLFLNIIIIILILPGILFEFMPSISNFQMLISFLISVFIIELINNINRKRSVIESIPKENTKKHFFNEKYLSKFSLPIFIGIYLLSILPNNIFSKYDFINLSFFEDIILDTNIFLEKSNSVLPIYFDLGFKGAMSNGYLGQGGFRYSNSPVMNVYSDSKNPIYLRTWVGKNYNYNRWFSFEKEEMLNYKDKFGDEFIPEQITWNFFKAISEFSSLGSQMNKCISLMDIDIEYTNINKNILYIPSIAIDVQRYVDKGYFENEGEGIFTINDIFDAKKGYSINSIMPIYSSSITEYVIETADRLYREIKGNTYEYDIEQKYRDFVYSNYVFLPKPIFSNIESFSNSIVDNSMTKFQKVMAVQNYLSHNYVYNLNPPKINDKNKDFVEYFLFESKEGYCTYYATSMVLMLRSLGIPARYVEGYLLQDDSIEVNGKYKYVVNDSNAHAWPEVYFDAIGWLPFEPTVTFTAGLFSDKKADESNNINLLEYDDQIYYEDNEEDTIQDEDIESSETNDLIDEYNDEFSNINNNKNYLWVYLIVFMLIIGYIILRYKNTKHFNYNKFKSSEQIIIYIFEQLERINLVRGEFELPTKFALKVDNELSYDTNIYFSSIIDITFKVRFSEDKISEEEFNILKDYAKKVSNVIYIKSNIFKKFYYKHILFIPIP